MKEKFANLISVKSIMTLMLTLVFCWLALSKVISGQEFLTIFTVIVGFYFGTQYQKKEQQVAGTAHKAADEPMLYEQVDAVAVKTVRETTASEQLQPPNEKHPIGFEV